jgi:hypothetical protein
MKTDIISSAPALVHGIFEIIGAIELRKEIDNEWMLILGGLLSAVFGLIVLFAPGPGALGLIWAIASYSIVFGILFIALALRLRKYGHAAGAGRGGRTEPLTNLSQSAASPGAAVRVLALGDAFETSSNSCRHE